MPFRQEQVERDCPIDECTGQVLYYSEEGENGPYADGSYTNWTFLVMSDDDQKCSEGHTFSPEEVERMERDATDAYQQSFYVDEP